jgi:branched-chain amino acid transport system permease protein
VRAFLVLAGLLALAGMPLLLPSYQLGIASEILIFSVLAMSVNLLAGYAGRTPLCHGAIFGTSTYVVIIAAAAGVPVWAACLLGVAAAGGLSVVFGIIAVRTSGVYFLLLTLALGLIIWGICLRWTGVTGGENGLRGDLRHGWLADPRRLYWLILGVGAVLTFAMWRLVRSPFGLTLRAIKDSPSRMAALGHNVPAHLFAAFVASGLFAGAAGALYALFNDFVSPTTVALPQSVEGLLMAIVGGVGSILGGLVGAFVLIALEQFVSAYTERWLSVLGLTAIAIMLFAPQGLLGLLKRKST